MDDLKLLALSVIVVFLIMTLSGFIISLTSTKLQCSKLSLLENFKQGLISAGFPTIIYGVASYFLDVRKYFSNTLESFGVSKELSPMLGVGYLVMLSSWISTVYNINNSEKNVCAPDVNEMTQFKKKLLSELAQKEQAKESHASKNNNLNVK